MQASAGARTREAGEKAQVVEFLTRIHAALVQSLTLDKQGLVVHACHPRSWKVEARGSEVQSQAIKMAQ